MELHLSYPSSSPLFSKPKSTILIKFPSISIFFANLRSQRRSRHGRLLKISSSSSAAAMMTLEQPGGKMVVELVGAFNELTERMSHRTILSSSSSRLLFKALKLSIPVLHSLPLLPDGRSPLSKALSVAVILADLQVNPVRIITLCLI